MYKYQKNGYLSFLNNNLLIASCNSEDMINLKFFEPSNLLNTTFKLSLFLNKSLKMFFTVF